MDFSSVQPLLDWVEQHPHWAGVLTMLIACGESLAMVGIIVPGIAMLWGVGALVGLGKLELFPILVWTAIGAFIGDVASYWLGYRFNEQLRTIWPLNKYPDLIPKGEAFFVKHGGKSVVLGRFGGPLRAVIPAVAGILRMPIGRFIAIDIFAAIVWAPPTILPGVAIGASLGIASEIASRLIVVVLAVIVGVGLLFWLVRRIFNFLQPRADALLEKAVVWSKSHRYLGIAIAAVVDPERPESRGLIFLGGALLLMVWAFLQILGSLSVAGPLLHVDGTVASVVHDFRTPWTDSMMIGFAALSEPAVIMVFAGVIAGWLLVGRYYLAAAHWVAAIAYGVLMPIALHVVLALPSFEFDSERIVAEAFPSMNMTLTTVVLGFFAVMLSREVPASLRWIPYGATLIMLTLVALALIYLEQQTVSNATGGFVLGLAWVFLLGIAYRRHAERNVAARAMAALSLSVLALSMAWRTTHIEQSQFETAVQERPAVAVYTADWLSSKWQDLAAFRSDWEGVATQPFTFQWAGDLDALKEKLAASGWHDPVPLTVWNVAQWLAPNPEFESLPVLPQIHDGKYAALVLTKHTDTPSRQLVLRLWHSRFKLQENGTPIWVGGVVYLDMIRRFDMFVYPRTLGRYIGPLDTLALDLGEKAFRRVHRPEVGDKYGVAWNGDVLLATQSP